MRSRLLLALGLACALLAALAWFALSDGGAASSAQRGGSAPRAADSASGLEDSDTAGVRTAALEPAEVSARAASAATDAAGRDHVVRARLVDLDGRPLADGELELRLGELSASARSSGAGELELALALPRGAARDAEAALTARARGCADLRLKRSLGRGEVTWLGDLALAPGGSLGGRVVDTRRRPVAGARIALDAADGASPEQLADLRLRGPFFASNVAWLATSGGRTAETDGDGRFRFDGLAPGHWRLWAGAPGCAWTIVPAQALRGGDELVELELVLEPADPTQVLRGRVLAPDGAPVSGAQVTAHLVDPDAYGWDTTATDAQGRFSFGIANRAPRRIRVEPPRWEWEPIEVASAQPGAAELDLRFAESTWLWVRVVDEHGAPLAHGRVWGESAAESPIPLARVVSDVWPDGRARLHRPAEDFLLRLDIPGYERTRSEVFALQGLVEPIVLVARRGEALRGRVTAHGRPVGGARVYRQNARDPDKKRVTSNWSGEGEPFVSLLGSYAQPAATTDAQGRFALERPQPDAAEVPPIYVRVAADGYASALLGPMACTAPAGAPELEVELAAGGCIEGRLVLEPAGDTAGWTVRAHDGMGERAAANVGPDGRFTFEHLHSGGWQLRAFRPATAFQANTYRSVVGEMPAPDVVVSEGTTAQYQLNVADRSATLAGRLSLRGGAIGAWSVRVRRAEAMVVGPVIPIDPDGGFRYRSAGGGEFELYLSSGDSRFRAVEIWDRVELAPGANTWELELDFGRVRGRWTAPAGSPEPKAQLRHVWRGPGSLRVTSRIDIDGAGAFGPAAVHAGRGELAIEPLEAFGRLRTLGYVGDSPAPPSEPPKTLTVDVPSDGELALDLP